VTVCTDNRPVFCLEEFTMQPTVVITVQEGDRISQEVRIRRKASCTVGRSSDCEVRLPCDNAHFRISRRHCVLDVDPPVAWVRDLGSLNGTYVNGRCIGQRGSTDTLPGGQRCRLSPGDVIRLGSTLLRYDVLAEDELGSAAGSKTEVLQAYSA
jgi:pSer/pThr/pTyr-binding forkhead associated (FHA) protein